MEITINYKGIEFDVEFDYQPFEPAERGPEAQYPGCSEAIEGINEIKHKDTCFMEFFEDELDEIETAIWEAMAERSNNRY